MSATNLVLVEPGLEDLARGANRELEGVRAAREGMLLHGIAAGKYLLQAQERFEGEDLWESWIAANFEGSLSLAEQFMRLAAYEQFVLEHELTSVQGGLRLLRELGLQRTGGTRKLLRLPDAIRVEALQLREKGASRREVAELLGISTVTINRWEDPDYARRSALRSKHYNAQRRSERKALKEQEQRLRIKHAIQKAGGARAELYTMAERMQDILAQAHREASDREARQAFSLAGEHYRKMRDEIVRGVLREDQAA